jgi:hypothetical protein
LGPLAAGTPEDYPKAQGLGLDALLLEEELTATARPTLLLLLAATGFSS